MNETEYKIYCENKLIAKFINVDDRDQYLGFLSEMYNDYEFSKWERSKAMNYKHTRRFLKKEIHACRIYVKVCKAYLQDAFISKSSKENEKYRLKRLKSAIKELKEFKAELKSLLEQSNE